MIGRPSIDLSALAEQALPVVPTTDIERRNAIHAAAVVTGKVQKIIRLRGLGDLKKAKAVEAGTIGFLISRNIKPGHLTWATIELHSFSRGQHA